jgi:hypothetical protein
VRAGGAVVDKIVITREGEIEINVKAADASAPDRGERAA